MVKVYNFKYINCYLYCEDLHGRQASGDQGAINKKGAFETAPF
jgi:hypothetical protein